MEASFSTVITQMSLNSSNVSTPTASYSLCFHNISVVGILGLSKQKNRPGVTAPPSPGYCVAICFVLVGCWRGARPYVSIMRRWAICLYWLAVGVGLGHMFLLCGARLYVSIGWL